MTARVSGATTTTTTTTRRMGRRRKTLGARGRRGAVTPRAQAVSQEYAMNEEGVLMPTGKYCVNHAETVRRKTRTVNVGNVKIGS